MGSGRLKISILLSLYYSLLMWIYSEMLAPRWGYNGFDDKLNEVSLGMSFFGLLLCIFTFIQYHRIDKPSSLVLNLFILLFYIPLYVLVAYLDVDFGFYLFTILYQFVFYLFYKYKNFSFRPILYRSKDIFFWIIGFILVSTFFITAYYNGFNIKIDLSDVYENRLAVRDLSIPSIFNYIKAASYFVGILALMYALQVKNWTLVFFIVLLQLMTFAFGASKTQFFTIFICFIAYYFYTDRVRLWAPMALTILLGVSVIEFKVFDLTSINDIWTRRSLFTPPKISYQMFDFLEDPDHEFLYLRGSVLKIFGLEDPYAAENGFQRVIGLKYGGSEDTNANTGLLGNDYAQLGWWAVLFYPFIRVYLLKLYDYCAIGIDKRIMVVLSIFISFTYISGAFFSVLITNGVLLVCYLLYLYPRARK